MRYARSRQAKDAVDLAYRIYVTDTLQLLGAGKSRSDRFYDRIKPRKLDNRPAEEVANDILHRAGIEVVNDGGV